MRRPNVRQIEITTPKPAMQPLLTLPSPGIQHRINSMADKQKKYRPRNPAKGIEIGEKAWIWLFIVFYSGLILGVGYLFARGIIIHPY